MKRWALMVIVGALIAIGRPVFAADWSIDHFATQVWMNTDASIQVEEKIDVNFSIAKHGIFRDIPDTYATTDGGTARIPLTIKGVLMDDHSIPVSQSRNGDNIELKIGDPNQAITGTHRYQIDYTAKAAVNFFSDHDELYWNITGSNWEVPINDVTVDVHPNWIQTPGQKFTTACYTGPVGSTASDCTLPADPSGPLTFSAKDFLTIVVGWPKGLVTKPGNYDQLRHPTLIDSVVGDHGRWWMIWLVFANLVWPLGTLGGLIWWWARHGRDPAGKKAIVPQYEPPNQLRPALLRMVQKETVTKEMIGATIVDLAVRGYLKITEVRTPGIMGIGGEKKYTLGKMKEFEGDTSLLDFEKQFLVAAFTGSPAVDMASQLVSGHFKEAWQEAKTGLTDGIETMVDTKARTSVDLNELKLTFFTTWKEMQSSMYRQVTTDGYFLANPKTVRVKYLIVGAVVFGLGWLATVIGWFGLPLSGLMVMIFSRWLPQRTAQGVETAWAAKGFKLYLATAEKYRLEWQEKEHIFETFLPYAMVFGVAEKWSKALAPLATTPPTWFEGQPGTTFNTMVLYSALNSFNTVAMHTVVSPAASGGSGFGGGGFSGGGGGGGGGGSW